MLPLQQDTACALEVVQGKADAFLYDQMSIYQFAKKHPDTTRGLLEPFQKESWAIGIRKGNTELENQVNAFLADFKAQQGLRRARRQVSEGRQGSVQARWAFRFTSSQPLSSTRAPLFGLIFSATGL